MPLVLSDAAVLRVSVLRASDVWVVLETMRRLLGCVVGADNTSPPRRELVSTPGTFCSICTTVNYAARYERVFCLVCNEAAERDAADAMDIR